MEVRTIKYLSAFLALLVLMYTIVSFMDTDPNTGSITSTQESVGKGVVYLLMTIGLVYSISFVE